VASRERPELSKNNDGLLQAQEDPASIV